MVKSVDLLLKEMNHDPNEYNALLNETMSLTSSPTKPLNFLNKDHTQELISSILSLSKENNSSSDTYTSDTEGATQQGDTLKKSTTTATENSSNIINPPSILKKSTMNSPKKVLFTDNTPEVHLYPQEISASEEDEDKSISFDSNGITHEWNDLQAPQDTSPSNPSLLQYSASAAATEILKDTGGVVVDDEDGNEVLELTKSQLTKHSSHSDLTLTEKMSYFLDNRNENHDDEDLDVHLGKLEGAFDNKTHHNILSLSKDIQTHRSPVQESMLDSLAKIGNEESELRSSGSSQSSLASLAQSNRQLISQSLGNSVQGIQMKNGVKGVTDDFIDQLAPQTDSHKVQDESIQLPLSKVVPPTSPRIAILSTETSSNDEFHDSFDQSYVQTEQSIMNLLNASAKNTPISSSVPKFGEQSNGQLKYETPSLLDLPLPDIDEPSMIEANGLHTQTESHHAPKPSPLQLKLNTQQHGHIIKTEPLDGGEYIIKKEPTDGSLVSYIDQTDGTSFDGSENGAKVESVSGYGRHSDSRDVKLVKTPPLSPGNPSPSNNNDSVNDSSVADESSLKFSIRFQMDSDWKLESSHDGDKEDNTEFTNNNFSQARAINTEENLLDDIQTGSRNEIDSNSNSNNDNNEKQEVRKEISSLEPPFSTNKNNTNNNDNNNDNNISISDNTNDENSNDLQINALANSSNVAPPEDFTLPDIEPNLHTSFDEISKSLQADYYEESLSAEYDLANKKTDFRDIWHSQRQKNKREGAVKKPLTSIPVSQSTYFSSVHSSLPTPLKSNRKIFKEINVTTRRVVSPGFEDLQVSGFLPELSEDSGFASKFQFNSSEAAAATPEVTTTEEVKRPSQPKNPRIKIHSIPTVNTSNILDNVDDNPNVVEPPLPQRSGSRGNFKVNYASAPQEHRIESKASLLQQSANKKPSRFRVPTFEIKRTKSALSPIDKYNNDIFSDVLGKRSSSIHDKPTIMGNGMKTLPSMDREDVKRILSTKRLISQDEYKEMKLNHMEKDTIITMQNGKKFDELQQHASIYNMSSEDDRGEADTLPTHIASELLKTPTELQEKDGFFGIEHDAFTSVDNNPLLTLVPPRPKRTAIKINLSPTKNYEGERFPEFSVEEPEPEKEVSDPIFNGNEIVHSKIRTKRLSSYNRTPPLDLNEFEHKDDINQQRQISTVSVPTIESKDTTHSVVNHNVTSPRLTTIAQEYRKNNGVQPQTSTVSESSSQEEEESGRLFFKVIGMKGIQLPDIGDHNGNVSVTLDNGVHCIKTPQYGLQSNSVLIGKEFELVVGRSLQFILTLKMSYHQPKDKLVEVKETKKVKSKNRFSRVFGKKDLITETKVVTKKIKDSWQDTFAQDGSFARCYVDLSQYEHKISGKALSFDLTCFNEWATYDVNGTKTKKKPYKIGQLEVKMLFIPKTHKNEPMPASIGHAYRSIEKLQQEAQIELDGYMNQEGGDCEVWKRRFFKLRGSSLIAHSEISHKSRSKINLSKVVDVVYMDKENTASTTTTGKKNVRNFTDGLFFENAFQIKFANGEVITFGATNELEKHSWVKAIEKIIYDNQFRRLPWVRLMLERNLPDMF
ncbi:Bud site selection protein bud4 [Scheffersomyces spartinae]|uniref:Bud site selection protein bud4 n=1 Tax=Scheffersomyces spartinae TaxID=45513 RepID=A0A9P7VDA5_9ASCO|nr:Bud site selection protein bud4 [Scheffersomyces spartinae]KAG7195398.1 Bud site selection protein bud4 [Scheffersomyces spartinae]